MERIEASLLIPGNTEPVPDGVVVLDESGTISYAGPAAEAPHTSGATITRAAAVMPGMWDCHGHFMGMRTLDLEKMPHEPVAVRAARCARDLRAALDAGVTSVREVGGLGVYLARPLEEGLLEGPSVYGAGSILSTTGGHGDLHSLPLSWVSDFAHQGGNQRLCDGTDDCMRAVREQLRVGAKVIKVCASGGVMSVVDDPVHQQFTRAELRAIVEVAAMADRAVAAHCHGKPGIMAALDAGVRTIEHGTYLDEEACDAMRETGAMLVPTLTIVDEILTAGGAPEYAMDKLRGIAERHRKAVALAHERGVTIVSGTDIAFSGRDLPNSWGRNGRELPLLANAGLTPLEAIEAATANGPLTLGPQAPRSGRLAEGCDADVITLDADPTADITVLADPSHVTAVWKAGKKVKA
ncbi:MAG: metal-dependent hydrolase family protein [Streptosporangiales bacterium]